MKKAFPGFKLRNAALLAAAGALAAFFAARADAGEVAAVVSSDSGPYAEAYASFKEALAGVPIDFYNVSAPDFSAPEETTYAAAFGAKATALDYPPGTHLVYALTPVTGHRGWHEISMLPKPKEALAAYKGFQPGLRRLAVFWAVYPGDAYIEELRTAGETAGIEIISAKLKSPDSFPDRLRRLMGKMDAFWLMPDPALITQASLLVLADFSCANAIPFYAPTHALVGNGATASFSPDFAQAGAAAARAISAIRSGNRIPPVTYPEKAGMKLNETLREKCRWPVKW